MFDIYSKTITENIHEKENSYGRVRQNGKTFNSYVSKFRSEQKNNDRDYLSADRTRAIHNDRETNSEIRAKTRGNRAGSDRYGVRSSRDSNKIVEYDFENRIMTYNDGTKVSFSKSGNEVKQQANLTKKKVYSKLKNPTEWLDFFILFVLFRNAVDA